MWCGPTVESVKRTAFQMIVKRNAENQGGLAAGFQLALDRFQALFKSSARASFDQRTPQRAPPAFERVGAESVAVQQVERVGRRDRVTGNREPERRVEIPAGA